jgi:CubicO group peptidase (beta-lactamase class C family)
MRLDPKLDIVLEEIVARWGVPGLAVGIVENSEMVYGRGFGVRSLETQALVTPDSVFCLASIAKCFVASAVLQLVEQGKLELDAPLVRYLPDFRLEDERSGQITLRQILSHTSGMPDMDEDEYNELVAHPEYDEGAAERYVRALSGRKLIAAPGERFIYSNIAYNVLGYLISRISGQPFEAFMQERIMQPAGMQDSSFFPGDIDQRRLVKPHLRVPEMIVNPIFPYHRADAPASFLFSSMTEMCHWAITCLKRGIYNQQRILTPASYDLMWTPAAKRGSPPFREEMGLGWALGHFEGVRTVGHGGGGFGWTCFLVLLPEKNSAAIILCNEESSAHDLALRAVVRAMLGLEPQSGSVSWMVPVSQALQTGGIPAAYACYDEIKDDPYYFKDDYELISLVYQMMSVQRFDLALEILELNLKVFPKSLGSLVVQARISLKLGHRDQAEQILRHALTVAPESITVTNMLAAITHEKG